MTHAYNSLKLPPNYKEWSLKKHNNHNNIEIENNYRSCLDEYYQIF